MLVGLRIGIIFLSVMMPIVCCSSQDSSMMNHQKPIGKACRFFNVQGTVQQVHFRAYTQVTADTLHITGWVKNTDDGRVESLACGNTEDLDEFERLLWVGSPRSTVTLVESSIEPYAPFDDFKRHYS